MIQSHPKTSKVEVIETKKKPLTKSEWILEYKALEEKHETLLKENDSNIREIARLKEEKSPKLFRDQDFQTKAHSDYVEISCTVCIFLARIIFLTLSKINLAVCVITGVDLKRN